ncbi:hypothetical protein BV20DRAFT_1050236 [Pilatotrama ljubarskyi]|nr:hypothetical protein BV20DRAFT_1050236 [Pilatotrama ljubarskyi]
MAGVSAGDYFRLTRFLRGDSSVETEYGNTSAPGSPRAEPHPASPVPQIVHEFTTAIPDADVTCKPSSEGLGGSTISFAAHQSVLSMFSPVLKTRLAEARDPTRRLAGHPSSGQQPVVLEIEGSPELVSRLLSVCYGRTDDLSSASLEILAKLTLAVKWYEMRMVAGCTQAAWDQRAALSPVEAYIVAIRHGLREHARKAAAKVLERPLKDYAYVSAMEAAPALAYHRLMQYFDSCSRAVQKCFARAAKEIPKHGCKEKLNGGKEGLYTTTSVPTALQEAGRGGDIGPRADLTHLVREILTTAEYMGDSTASAVMRRVLVQTLDLPTKVKAALRNIQIEVD